MVSYSICTLILCFSAWEIGTAFEFWNDFRVTWGMQPGGSSYSRLPRNTVDAISDGWKNTSTTCTNNGRFFGYRWIDVKDDNIALLFDSNGYIAGMQAMIPYDKAVLTQYPYENIPMYQRTMMNGKSYYSLTVYFISPDLICRPRRSSLLKNIGSSSQVYFQNGPTPAYLKHGPKQRRNAEREGWQSGSCFPGMGWHNFYHVDQWDNQNCLEMFPSCLLYNRNDEMHGFCFIIPGRFPAKRYENVVTRHSLGAILGIKKTPQCTIDLAERMGFSSLHVYLTNSPWRVGSGCA